MISNASLTYLLSLPAPTRNERRPDGAALVPGRAGARRAARHAPLLLLLGRVAPPARALLRRPASALRVTLQHRTSSLKRNDTPKR